MYIPDSFTRWLHIYIWLFYIHRELLLLLHLLSEAYIYGIETNKILFSLALVNAWSVPLYDDVPYVEC